jgi:hypothetical protein
LRETLLVACLEPLKAVTTGSCSYTPFSFG